MRTLAKGLLIMLALTAYGWAEPDRTIGKIQWYTNYDKALKVAKIEQKPLWLHFGEDPG